MAPWLVLFSFFYLAITNGVQGRQLPSGVATTQVTNRTNVQPARKDGYHVDLAALCFSPESEYYGARASISVYGVPVVATNQSSSAAIWVINRKPDMNGTDEPINVIQAGWHVSPELYGDTQTRLFTYWTVDHHHKTGCYNVRCSGFVIESGSPIEPGDILSSLSTYGGEQKYITLNISMDSKTGHWWLFYIDKANAEVAIGYWPKSLFTSLADKANIIQYGGSTTFLENAEGPPMGSGHFPSEGDAKAASFRDLQFVGKNKTLNGFQLNDLVIYTDNRLCYGGSLRASGDGLDFYFGGPGHCKNGN